MATATFSPVQIQTIEQAIEMISYFQEEKSIKKVRQFIQQIDSEEEAYRLIRLLDAGMMLDYGSFLAKRAHRRFRSARTFSWVCHDLISRGALFQVERIIEEYLLQLEDAPNEVMNTIRKVQINLFSTLQRIPEAKEVKQALEEAGGTLSPDQLSSFLTQTQQYTEAERVLQEGLANTYEERGDIAYLSYAHLLSKNGNYERAIQLLEEGEKAFGHYPAFAIDRLLYLYHSGDLESFVQQFPAVHEHNPYYVQKSYYSYLKARALYELERWEELDDWVTSNRELFEDTMFNNTAFEKELSRRELALTPLQQQVNYCVPASLSMLLDMNGVRKTQEEIAEHVFDRTGSKITTTIQYMASLGFQARLFQGSVERFKHLIDNGVLVLLDFFIDNSSHVQLVKGYDDRMSMLILQDPNSLQAVHVSYEQFDMLYKLKDRLSIVFVRPEQTALLDELPMEEHCYFSDVLHCLDVYEEDEERGIEEVQACFTKYQGKIYPMVLGLSYIQHDQVKEHVDEWRSKLIDAFGLEDFEVQMLIANSYLRNNDFEQYQQMMKNVKARSSYTYFILGLAAYQNDQYAEAIPYFERSIERDPYQPIVFTYLAICYQYLQVANRANAFAAAALWQDDTNEFIRSTYANTLLDLNKTSKAQAIYLDLFNEAHSNHAYYAYEIGRCYVGQDDDKAIEWFALSKEHDGTVPYPYLRIAEIWKERESFREANDVLLQGVQAVPVEKGALLWQYIGYNYNELEDYVNAEKAFAQAGLYDDEGENLSVIYEAQAIYRQGDFERAIQTIQQYDGKNNQAELLFRAGAMLFEESDDNDELEVALRFMEEGLQEIEEEIEPFVRMYTDYLENTNVVERGAACIAQLRRKFQSVNLLCYEAILRQELYEFREAGDLLAEAIDLEPSNSFSQYRLGLLYRAVDKLPEAVEQMHIALQLDAELDGAKDELVQLYAELEQFEEAKRYALELFHSYPPLCNVQQLVDWLNDEEKEWLFHQMKKLEGKVDEEWRLLGLSELLPLEDALRLIEEGDTPRLKRQYATLLNRQGAYKQAFTIVKELIIEYPEDETLYTLWAESTYLLRRHQRMTLTIQRLKVSKEEKSAICRNLATAFLPYLANYMDQLSDEGSFFQRMKTLFKQAPLNVAVDDLFTAAYKYDPTDYRAYYTYGQFLYDAGNFVEAYRELTKYLARYEDEDVLQLAGLSALMFGFFNNKQSYILKACNHFDRLTEVAPYYYYGWKYQGDAEFCIGNYDDAIRLYEKAIEINSMTPEAFASLLMVYEATGQYEALQQLFFSADSDLQQRIMEEMDSSFFSMTNVQMYIQSLVEKSV